MANCKDCIYYKMCYWIAVFNEETLCEHFIHTADVVPKNEVEKLQIEIEALKIANDKMYSAIEETKAEVIEEYRQRVNVKMGKHTHLLGKEYVQRILREVAKEMKNERTRCNRNSF